jgi:hypothetical protein
LPIRTLIALASCGFLAGCANDMNPSSRLGAGGLASPAAAAEMMIPDVMPKKTMSDRILAAMALERVTGLKPDPARLSD